MKFSEFMRHAREGQQLSLNQLARISGITPQHLNLIEMEKTQPTLPKAELICRALGVKYVIGE